MLMSERTTSGGLPAAARAEKRSRAAWPSGVTSTERPASARRPSRTLRTLASSSARRTVGRAAAGLAPDMGGHHGEESLLEAGAGEGGPGNDLDEGGGLAEEV